MGACDGQTRRPAAAHRCRGSVARQVGSVAPAVSRRGMGLFWLMMAWDSRMGKPPRVVSPQRVLTKVRTAMISRWLRRSPKAGMALLEPGRPGDFPEFAALVDNLAKEPVGMVPGVPVAVEGRAGCRRACWCASRAAPPRLRRGRPRSWRQRGCGRAFPVGKGPRWPTP